MEYIRKATPADAERIRFIAEQCWWLASGDTGAQRQIEQMVQDLYSQGRLTNEINSGISVFLLVIDRESSVAFTSYAFRGDDIISCELNALYCLPETQGKRFDELLVNEVVRNTIAVGGSSIFVVLSNYNGPTSLFERLGFESHKTSDPDKLTSEILIMSKDLGSSYAAPL